MGLRRDGWTGERGGKERRSDVFFSVERCRCIGR